MWYELRLKLLLNFYTITNTTGLIVSILTSPCLSGEIRDPFAFVEVLKKVLDAQTFANQVAFLILRKLTAQEQSWVQHYQESNKNVQLPSINPRLRWANLPTSLMPTGPLISRPERKFLLKLVGVARSRVKLADFMIQQILNDQEAADLKKEKEEEAKKEEGKEEEKDKGRFFFFFFIAIFFFIANRIPILLYFYYILRFILGFRPKKDDLKKKKDQRLFLTLVESQNLLLDSLEKQVSVLEYAYFLEDCDEVILDTLINNFVVFALYSEKLIDLMRTKRVYHARSYVSRTPMPLVIIEDSVSQTPMPRESLDVEDSLQPENRNPFSLDGLELDPDPLLQFLNQGAIFEKALDSTLNLDPKPKSIDLEVLRTRYKDATPHIERMQKEAEKRRAASQGVYTEFFGPDDDDDWDWDDFFGFGSKQKVPT